MDVTLKDGPIAHIITAESNNVAIGDKLMINGIEASPSIYTTTNGMTITVGDSGVIDFITKSGDDTLEKILSKIETLIGKIDNQ